MLCTTAEQILLSENVLKLAFVSDTLGTMPKRAIASPTTVLSTKRRKRKATESIPSISSTPSSKSYQRKCTSDRCAKKRNRSTNVSTISEEIATSNKTPRNTHNLTQGFRRNDKKESAKRFNTTSNGKVARKSSKMEGNRSRTTGIVENSSPTVKKTPVVAKKLRSYRVKTKEDKHYCWITGITITNDGRILVVDRGNFTLKAFSQSMKLQSTLRFREYVWDITILSDAEAVLGTSTDKYLVVDISGNQLQVTRTYHLPFAVYSACTLNDRFIAVAYDSSMGVKKFDLSGKVYWSVPENFEGQSLYPAYVHRQGNINSSSVLVTDQILNAILCIDGENGTITKKVQLKGQTPSGVTYDSDRNMYVCMSGTDEILVLSADMSEQKVLLTNKDKLRKSPQAIVYDALSRCLIISYMSGGILDTFQIV